MFAEIGAFMGDGLAIGLEDATPRVSAAADRLANAAVDSADRITAAFSSDRWATDVNSRIEHSFGDVSSSLSNRDIVGAIRRQSGDLDQSATLGAILTVLQAIYDQSGGGNAALGAQSSRRFAELGAF